MKKLFFTIIAIVLAFLAYSWLKSDKKRDTLSNSNTIIVGTSADFKPFSFKQDGAIVGFDIDLVREVCKRLGKTMELRDMPFELLIPQLQLGSVHVVAAGMTPTPVRAERVFFSQPYLSGDSLIVLTQAQNPPLMNISDLDGKEVIVNQGYTADSYMSGRQGPLLKRLPSVADALLALTSGRAYAFVTASNTIKPFFEHYSKAAFNTFTIDGTQESTALAISRRYPELAQHIDQIITQLVSDGTLASLKEKWHVI